MTRDNTPSFDWYCKLIVSVSFTVAFHSAYVYVHAKPHPRMPPLGDAAAHRCKHEASATIPRCIRPRKITS